MRKVGCVARGRVAIRLIVDDGHNETRYYGGTTLERDRRRAERGVPTRTWARAEGAALARELQARFGGPDPFGVRTDYRVEDAGSGGPADEGSGA